MVLKVFRHLYEPKNRGVKLSSVCACYRLVLELPNAESLAKLVDPELDYRDHDYFQLCSYASHCTALYSNKITFENSLPKKKKKTPSVSSGSASEMFLESQDLTKHVSPHEKWDSHFVFQSICFKTHISNIQTQTF